LPRLSAREDMLSKLKEWRAHCFGLSSNKLITATEDFRAKTTFPDGPKSIQLVAGVGFEPMP